MIIDYCRGMLVSSRIWKRTTSLFLVPLFVVLLISKVTSQCAEIDIQNVYFECNSDGTSTDEFYIDITFIPLAMSGTYTFTDAMGNTPTIMADIGDVFDFGVPSPGSYTLTSGMSFTYEFGPFTDGDAFDVTIETPNGCIIDVMAGTYDCDDNISGGCETDVPFYDLDFTGDPDGVFDINYTERFEECCMSGDRCVEFKITLDPNTEGISADISGGGGFVYSVLVDDFDCADFPTTNQQQNMLPNIQDDVCLTAGETYFVFMCKSGANQNEITINGLPKPGIIPMPDISQICDVDLMVQNLTDFTWSSVADLGLDNLECTTPCTDESPVTFLYNEVEFGIVTDCDGVVFDYTVTGMPLNTNCSTGTVMASTTVTVYPEFNIMLETQCNDDGTMNITATPTGNGALCSYLFDWSNGEMTQTIVVDQDGAEYCVDVKRTNDVEECSVISMCINANCCIESATCNIMDQDVEGCSADDAPAPFTLPAEVFTMMENCGGITELQLSADTTGMLCMNGISLDRIYYLVIGGDTIASCMQTITIKDTTNPVIVAPDDITLEACTADITTVTAGNTGFDYSETLVTLTQAEEAIFLGLMGASVTEACGYELTYIDVAAETCPTIVTRTWTITDTCDNVDMDSQLISVGDAIDPIIVAPDDITLEACTADITTVTAGNTGFDYSETLVTLTQAEEAIFLGLTGASVTEACGYELTYIDVAAETCPTIVTRTWTITDTCGNTAMDTQLITVDDTTAPVWNANQNLDQNVECDSEVIIPTDPMAMDDCGTPVISVVSDVTTVGPSGCTDEDYVRVIKYVATDGCLNESDTFYTNIIVLDATPPVMDCDLLSDLVLECGIDDESDIDAWVSSIESLIDANVTDNCGGDVEVSNNYVGGLPPLSCDLSVGLDISFYIEDCVGNVDSCILQAFMDDTIAPGISCPDDIETAMCNMIELMNIMPSISGTLEGVTLLEFIGFGGTASDDCGLDTIEYIDVYITDTPMLIEIERTYYATDVCNNIDSCKQQIVLIEFVVPDPPIVMDIEVCDGEKPVISPDAGNPLNQPILIASDDFDAPVGLSVISNTTDLGTVFDHEDQFTSGGDLFGITTGLSDDPMPRQAPFALADDAADSGCSNYFPADDLGPIPCNYGNNYFGVVDTENGDNMGTVSVDWIFDVSTATEGVSMICVDVSAMGDFESTDTHDWSLDIDGGGFTNLFSLIVDDNGLASYDITNGPIVLNDPMTLNGEQVLNGFSKYCFPLSACPVGDELTLRLETVTNGGDEAVAYDNIEIYGSDLPEQVRFNFYDQDPMAGGISPVFTGPLYCPPTDVVSSPDTFYVTTTTCNGCESMPSQVIVNVYPIPDPPTVAYEPVLCAGGTIDPSDLLEVMCNGGQSIIATWWDAPVDGMQQGMGSTLDPLGLIAGAYDDNGISEASDTMPIPFDLTIPGVYTFFTQCEENGCVSDRTPVNITVVGNNSLKVTQECNFATPPAHGYEIELCFTVDQEGPSGQFYVVVEDTDIMLITILGPFNYSELIGGVTGNCITLNGSDFDAANKATVNVSIVDFDIVDGVPPQDASEACDSESFDEELCCQPDAGTQTSTDCNSFCVDEVTGLTVVGTTINIEVDFDDPSIVPIADLYHYAWLIVDSSTDLIVAAYESIEYNIGTPADFNEDIPLQDFFGAMLPEGMYCIYGLNYFNDPDTNPDITPPELEVPPNILVGMDIIAVADVLFENDGVMTTGGVSGTFTYCADLNLSSCIPFGILPVVAMQAVASCTDADGIPAGPGLWYVEVISVMGGIGVPFEVSDNQVPQTVLTAPNTPNGTYFFGPYTEGTVVITYTAMDNNSSNSNNCVNCSGTIMVLEPPFPNVIARGESVCEGETIFLREVGSGSTTWEWTGPNGFFSSEQNPIILDAVIGVHDGTYYVIGRNDDLCGNIDSIEIIINPNPEILEQPVTAFTCEGGSVTFSATAEVENGSPLIFELQNLNGATWVTIMTNTVDTDGSESVTFTLDNIPEDYNCSLWRILVTADHDPDPECSVASDTVPLLVHTGGFTLACNDQINVSLSPDCSLDLSPSMFLEGEMDICNIDPADYLDYFYEVIIKDQYGNPIDTSDLTNYIGTCLTVSVKELCGSMNSCWGQVCIEDKLPPLLDCTIQDDYTCLDVDKLISNPYLVQPVIQECSDYTLWHQVTVHKEECDSTQINILWLATDEYGNSSICEQVIKIGFPVASDYPAPELVVLLGCDDDIPGYEPGKIPYTGHTGYDGDLCESVVAVWSDQVIPACGGLCGDEIFKAIRTWTIIDWCDAASGPVTVTQVIKRTDKEPPTISEITGDSLVSANPWNCVYSGPLPTVWAHDACSEYTSVLVSGVLEDGSPMVIIGNNVFDAPKGTHVLTYTVSDCCGNVTTKNLNFVVFDGSAPTVITLQNIVISLTSDGTTDRGTGKIYTYHVDNGSYDGCTGVYLEVRRPAGDHACGNVNPIFNPPHNQNVTYDNTNHPQDHNRDLDGGAYIKVCCTDLTDEEDGVRFGMVKVWLRVWDDADMDGVYGSSGDNYNEGWTDVRVEDKSTPILICPPDVELTCDMDYNDLDMAGTARAFGICGDLDVLYDDIVRTNACNVGSILRVWYIDFNGNDTLEAVERTISCGPQEITIDSPYEFDGEIDWPGDQVNNPPNCDRAPGEPLWDDTPCSLVAWTLTASDTFEFESGACFKVLNYFTVIDWCQFKEDDCDLNLIDESCDDGLVSGYWTHIQEVKYLDNDPPEMDCNDECFNVDAACINHEVILKNTAFDAGACDTVVWLKWHVEVDLWGDGTVDVLFTSFNESIPGAIRVPVVPTASGEELSLNLGAPPANLTIPGSMYNHKVVWKVTDGCGNVTSCSSTFMVTDKKAPTPYCVDVSTALMEGDPGMVEVWACDFDLGSYDNCSDYENLWFTFSEVGPGVEWVQSAGDYAYNLGHYFNNSGQFMRLFEWPHPANYVSGVWHYWDGSNCEGHIFTECGENEVRMYVWDEKAQLAWRGEVDAEIFGGNIDYCTITMTIGGENCEGQGREIGGHVNTEFGEGVTDIEMTNDADALGNQFPIHQMTDAGDYVFVDNVLGINYVLSGNSTTDYMNGVSTLDLLIIQKHILGIQLLDSPYKVIAADINDNEDVSATDLLILRKLILGVFDELPSNVSWIAVDADQVFADILDPFPVDKYKEVDNLQDNMMAEDFVAVKIGDVNLSAEANAQSVSSESRSNASLKLEVADADMAVGTVKVDVTSGNFASIYGYQYTMNLNGASLVDVESGAINMVHGVNTALLTDGTVTMSWNSKDAVSVGTDEVLFTLVLNVTESKHISEMLSINSRVTTAESYVGETYQVQGVELSLRGGDAVLDGEFALFQNEPNPFSVTSTIGFNLPTADAASVTIYDVTGKVVRVIEGDYDKGYNEIKVSNRDLGASGVLYYQLESGDFTATKKMILVE